MMATKSFILAFSMALIWPTIQSGLNGHSVQGLLDSNTGVAVFFIWFHQAFINSIRSTSHFHATVLFEFGLWKMQLVEIYSR